jgi:hypothetical protein
MGTKLQPGKFDCYNAAQPDEPVFVLLARDPDFQRLVREWAHRRQLAINCGEQPESDLPMVLEALETADAGATWLRVHPRRWRRPKE